MNFDNLLNKCCYRAFGDYVLLSQKTVSLAITFHLLLLSAYLLVMYFCLLLLNFLFIKAKREVFI